MYKMMSKFDMCAKMQCHRYHDDNLFLFNFENTITRPSHQNDFPRLAYCPKWSSWNVYSQFQRHDISCYWNFIFYLNYGGLNLVIMFWHSLVFDNRGNLIICGVFFSYSIHAICVCVLIVKILRNTFMQISVSIPTWNDMMLVAFMNHMKNAGHIHCQNE